MTEKLVLEKKDGKKIRGCIYLPEETGSRAPLVIFCHGLGSSFQELLHHGEGIARAGICCLLFDFCGGGPASLSDGVMEEMTLQSECRDLREVISWAKDLDYVDPERIFLQGESMGGLVSALVAAECPEVIRGVVLWYPAFGIPEGAGHRLRTGEREFFGFFLGKEFDLEARGMDVYGNIPAYRGPVLMVHGENDFIVPPGYSRRALSAYRDARLITIPGAGHGFDGADSAAARAYSISFIRQQGRILGKR